jgi:hypothetical protein
VELVIGFDFDFLVVVHLLFRWVIAIPLGNQGTKQCLEAGIIRSISSGADTSKVAFNGLLDNAISFPNRKPSQCFHQT